MVRLKGALQVGIVAYDGTRDVNNTPDIIGEDLVGASQLDLTV